MTDRVAIVYWGCLIGAPVVGIIGVLVPFVLGITNFAIIGLYLAIPMVVAPVVALAVRTRTPWLSPDRLSFDWRVFSTLFHTILAISLVTLVRSDVRPDSFFVGLALLYVLVFALITSSADRQHRDLVSLYHVIVTLLVTIYSVTFSYDFFVGRTDLTGHVSAVNSIVETGGLIDSGPYISFQFWHVYSAMTYHVFGGLLSTHRSMYLLSGLVFGAGVLATYSLSRRVYPNERVALLSSLLVIAFPMYIFYGMYAIPRSITSILLLALLITIFSRSTPRMRALEFGTILAIVLYHPVTITYVLVVLLVLAAVERYVTPPRVLVDNVTLASTGVFTATYWLYNAEYLVIRVVNTALVSIFEPSDQPTAPGVEANPWAEVINYSPNSFFVLFVLVGLLVWLRTDASARAPLTVVSITALLLIPLSMPGPTMLLDSLTGMNVGRFSHYTYMFLALTGGFGLYQLIARGGIELFVILILLMSLFTFAAVSNDFVATDNPAVERPFYTYYLTDQERQSFERIDLLYDGEVEADRPTNRYVREMIGGNATLINSSVDGNMFAESESVVFRHHEAEKRPLQFLDYVYVDDDVTAQLAERNRVYDSGAVTFHR